MSDWQETNPEDLPVAQLGGDGTTSFRKKSMRRELRRRMAGKTGDSAQVVRKIAAYLHGLPNVRVVALYAPLPGEVDLIALTQITNRIWVFPKIEGGALTFYQVTNADKELKPGSFGIAEPADGQPSVDVGKIDLFLCPGLGFDTHGGRIGRGKGFYDGILAKARPDSVKLGVCFDHQIVDQVVMEEHDIRMNGVISG